MSTLIILTADYISNEVADGGGGRGGVGRSHWRWRDWRRSDLGRVDTTRMPNKWRAFHQMPGGLNTRIHACKTCRIRLLDFAMVIHRHESHSAFVMHADGVEEKARGWTSGGRSILPTTSMICDDVGRERTGAWISWLSIKSLIRWIVEDADSVEEKARGWRTSIDIADDDQW